MQARDKRNDRVALCAAVVLLALALVVALVAPADGRAGRDLAPVAAKPHAVPSTTKPVVAFTSDYGELDDGTPGNPGLGGFNGLGSGPNTYEGEAGNGLVFMSTHGTNGEAQVYYYDGSSSGPIQITCDQRVKSHPVAISYTVPDPANPGFDYDVTVIAYAVRSSYAAAASSIEVVSFLSNESAISSTSAAPPVPPTPDCATGTNLTPVAFGGQSGDNEWPNFVGGGATASLVYSSTRDNPLGDIYVQQLGTDAAARLTDGTSDGVSDTQPFAVPAQGSTGYTNPGEAVVFTSTEFRADGSLATITYDPGAPTAVAPSRFVNPFRGLPDVPQSSQAWADTAQGTLPPVYFRSTDNDPYGDVESINTLNVDTLDGWQFDTNSGKVATYAAASGTAESDPGKVAFGRKSYDRDVVGASVDGVVAGDPTKRGTIVENDSGGTPPSRYDTSAPAYSPDGAKLAYSQSSATVAQVNNAVPPARSIWVANADGSNPVRLTQADPGDGFYIDTNPTYSPDGKTIAFQRIAYEQVSGGGLAVRSSLIYTMPADGSGAPSRVESAGTTGMYIDGSPTYAPNGKYLAISRTAVADVVANTYFDDTSVNSGSTTTLHVQFSNFGAAPASGRMVVSMPKVLTPTTADSPCTIDTSSSTANTVTCPVPDEIGYSTTRTLGITVRNDTASSGSQNVTATETVFTSQTELVTSNNTATATITANGGVVVKVRRPHLGAGIVDPIATGPLAREGQRGAPNLAANEPSEIWIIDPANGNAGALQPPSCPGRDRVSCAVSGRSPSWSPDGTHLAFEADGGVYDATLENVDSDPALEGASVITTVVGPGTQSRATLSEAGDPSWSGDGNSLYVTGQPAGSPQRTGIYSVKTDGTGVQLVAQGPGPESEPVVQPGTDLSVSASATPNDIYARQTTTISATVTNNGPQGATPTVTFAVPAGMTATSVPDGCTPAAPATGPVTITCTLPPLAAGTTSSVSIIATAADVTTATTDTFDVTVSAGRDTDPRNNTSSAAVIVRPLADLDVTIAANPDPVPTGASTTMSATVTNAGNGDAQNVQVTISVPAGVDPPTALSAGCTFTANAGPPVKPGGTVTCALGTLTAGGSQTVSFKATSEDSGVYPFTAQVTTTTPQSNDVGLTDTVRVQVTPHAGLSVGITAVPQTIEINKDTTTITTTVMNAGPDSAAPSGGETPPSGYVTLTITLPSGMSTPPTIPAECTINATDTQLTCQLAPIAAGGSKTITFTSTGLGLGDHQYTAHVSSSTPDDNPADNDASATVTVIPPRADLSVTMTAAPQTLVINADATTVTTTVTNNGPDTPKSATVTIAIPTGMTPPSMVAGCGAYTPDPTPPPAGTLTCTVNVLAPGSSVSFVFTSTGTVLGPHTFTANVTSDDESVQDPNPSNDNASAMVTVVRQVTDIAVTITPSVPTVAAGGSLTATVTVTNKGAYAAHDVTLSTHFDPRLQPTSTPACASGSAPCAVGTLTAGESSSYIVDLAPQHSGTPPQDYTATMSAKVTTSTPETTTANNTATASVRVRERRFVADVAVTLQLPTVAYVGGTVPARVTVVNHGPQPASDVRLRMAVPGTLHAVSTTACVTGTGVCLLGQLASGQSRTFTLRFTPARLNPERNYGAFVGARVSTTTAETTLVNNRDRVRLPVRQPMVRLLPPIGPPGFVTLVYGENLPPGAFVSFHWRTGVTAYGGPYRVQADGTVTAPMQVVRRDDLGYRRLVLNGRPGLFAPVGATMLVVQSQAAPPRFFGRG